MAEDTTDRGNKAWGTVEAPAALPSPEELQRQHNIRQGGAGLYHVAGEPPRRADAYNRSPTEAENQAWMNAEARMQAMRGLPVRHASEIHRENAQRLAEVEAQQDAERLERWGTNPREALRAAHEARRSAEAELARRREIRDRVQQRLSVMEGERDAAAKDAARLDALAADEAAKAWVLALEGGHEAALPAIPSDLDASRRHRDRAQGVLDQATAAMAFIEQGVQEAETGLAKAERDVLEAAEAIVISRGLAIADRMAELEAALETLRRSLDGLDRVWLSGPGAPSPRAVALPARLRRAFGGVISENAGTWDACLKALIADPETELP